MGPSLSPRAAHPQSWVGSTSGKPRSKRSCLTPSFFWAVCSTHDTGRVKRKNPCQDKNTHFGICVHPSNHLLSKHLFYDYFYFITILITTQLQPPAEAFPFKLLRKATKPNFLQLTRAQLQCNPRFGDSRNSIFLAPREGRMTGPAAQHGGLADLC